MATGIRNKQVNRNADITVSRLVNRGFETNLTPITLGKIYYVDSGHTSAKDVAGWGKRANKPFAKISFAVKQSTIVQGDVIIVQEGHAESITAADAWLWANAGVYVLGMGWGNTRPLITWDTAATATILMDKASCVLDNLRFIAGIDDIALMIQMTAAGNLIRRCLFTMDDSSFQALIGIDMGNVAADNCKILGNEFESASDGSDSAIKIATAVNALEIAGNTIWGDFDDAGIHNPTANVATNLKCHDNEVTNLATGQHAIELVSAVTGTIKDNDLVGDTLTAILDPGSCKCLGNRANIGIDQSSIPIPIGPANGPMTATKAAVAPASGATSLFTITGGLVEILAITGKVTTVIETQLNNTKLVYNPTGTGTSSDICAVYNITAGAVGILYSITGTFAGSLAPGAQNFISKTAAPATMATPITMGPGVIEQNCSATNTGAIQWTVLWRPLEVGAILVAN